MRRSKSISIRFSLLRSFVILILISSVTVLILMSIRAHETEKELSEKLIYKGMVHVTQELDRFFLPANKGALIAAQWGSAGMLNLAQVVAGQADTVTVQQTQAVNRLNSLLLPHLLLSDEISSLQIANARGDGFLILQPPKPGRIRNRVVSRQMWGTQTLWFEVKEDGKPVSSEWKDLDYEPRKRAWYTGVRDLPYGEVYWTEPYILFTTKDLGITASIKWNEGGMDHVIAYDVLLTAITEFTQRDTTQLSRHSQIAIFTDKWQAVGLPAHQQFRDQPSVQQAFLRPVADLGIPELVAAVKETTSKGQGAKEIFNFTCRRETWWAGVQTYPLGKMQHLWIAILVPNKDLLEGITQLRIYLLAATVVALLAALAYSFLLARSYSRPLEALAAQSRAIRELDFRDNEKIEAKLHEFKQLGEAQAQSLLALQSFARYVPIEVVKELVAKGEVARIGGRMETLTILFTDIAGFTKISESMSPQELTDHMAEYFQAMIDTLHKHAATVDKIVGDAIVAFWGAPTAMPEQAARSVKAVLECRDQLTALNDKWRAQGLPPLPTRFGLATGPVVVGNIGARTRLAYTVLGDTVNLASRLEGLNKVYGTAVLTEEQTWKACAHRYEWCHLDRIIVAGKTEPAEIFEVLGEAGEVSEKVLAGARRYEEAWEKYRSGDFGQALTVLQGFEMEFGPAGAVQLLRERCHHYLKQPPGEGWNGTSKMSTK
jgi:adenylate cyclase